MDFFRENPGIGGQVARVIFEYLGFIESNGVPGEDHPAYEIAHAIIANAGRAVLVVAVLIVEHQVVQFLGF